MRVQGYLALENRFKTHSVSPRKWRREPHLTSASPPSLHQTSSSVAGTVTRSNTSSALSELSDSRPRTAAVDNAYK